MAYPFGPMPKLGDFIECAVKHGAVLREFSGTLLGPRGPTRIRYLERTEDGTTYHVVLDDIADHQVLEPMRIKQMCRRLHLSPGIFECFKPTLS